MTRRSVLGLSCVARNLAAPTALLLVGGLTGCAKDPGNSLGVDTAMETGTGVPTTTTADEASDEEESEAEVSSGPCPDDGCLDLPPSMETGDDCNDEGGNCECEPPMHEPCDEANPDDVVNAMGLNCDGEFQVTINSTGNPLAYGTMDSFGPTDAFNPTEGTRFAILGSGFAADLPMDAFSGACSNDLGAFDIMQAFPAPIVMQDVGPVTCADDPSLIGTGDCSNSLQTQFEAAGTGGANDYTELRIDTAVPSLTTSFSFDFAFMSHEYPNYWLSSFNDMFFTWLESETWTGNISFDDDGNPITINAGFMDYLDGDADGYDPITGEIVPHPDCPIGTGCTAPELTGTCMDGHGATRWLTTTAPVNPDEEITIVFAIMDLSDSILDSYVFIDNFQWGCDGEQPPTTTPID